MICPHCSHHLSYRQRPGRRCAYCRKEFVFEPRHDRPRLHDVRVRKLAARLSAGGRLRFTLTQLWYAAARVDRPPRHLRPGRLSRLFGSMRRRRRRPPRVAMPPADSFEHQILRRWVNVYGAWPDDMVDEDHLTPPVVARPRVALVCPSRTVLACLAANGVPETLEMSLVRSPGDVPPAVPVVVIHDASADGCRLAAEVRAALPGRTVVDAGLRPNTVRRKVMLQLHTPIRPRAVAGLGLTAEERRWLGQRWWSPIAAVPPARLIAAVAKAAGRARSTDPELARAVRLGFLTWPAA